MAPLAPHDNVALPLVVMWGLVVFGTLPGLNRASGSALIMVAGIFAFLRDRARKAEERRTAQAGR